jgi:transcriptional regulator
MGDSTPEYIDGMLRAIVGIEIAIERFEGKSKLSQNREPRDLQGAVDKLREQGKITIAQAMENPLGK